MYQHMRYLFLFLLGIVPAALICQNPLKKELKGNTQSVHYSPSQFSFSNQVGKTVVVSNLNDNRALNWNKQVNDSVKIEAIGDFWNYPFKLLFNNKINQDLSKANVTTEAVSSENSYKIEPTLDVLYPNFHVYPTKGYWVLSKINMKVSKGTQTLFTKSYQEYTFFTKGNIDYKDAYNSDLKEGTNVAIWTSMKRLLDQFYKDLNDAMGGAAIASSNTELNVIQRTSNITNDPNLVNQQTAYSDVKKDKPKVEDENNYKIETPAALPPPTDGKLENAVNALGLKPKEEIKKVTPTITKPKTEAIATVTNKTVLTDSAKLANKKLRAKAIDSALKIKEEEIKIAKLNEEKEKANAKELASQDKLKKDSILKSNKESLALKLKEKNLADSIKRADINQKIELAKKKREEERAKQAAAIVKKSPKVDTTTIAKVVKPKASPKPKPEVIVKPKEAVKEIAKASPTENKELFTAPKQRVSKTGNEDIGEEVKRIAREVEMEENKLGNKYKINPKQAASTPLPATTTASVPDKIKAAPTTNVSRKTERDSFIAKLKAEKEKRELALNASKQVKLDSLLNLRKAKQAAIEAAIARTKAMKDSLKRDAEIVKVDPKKYEQDSIKLAQEKIRKRELILAAQKAARDAERDALLKNPNAGEQFALVSSDPPSKLPDSRTREQILSDRIFTPKSEISRDLLARVKLISPEEESKLMSQMKTGDVSTVDSFFIEQQKNRPIPTFKPIDTINQVIPKSSTEKRSIKEVSKSKDDKKAELVDKGLKTAKQIKDSTAKAMKAAATQVKDKNTAVVDTKSTTSEVPKVSVVDSAIKAKVIVPTSRPRTQKPTTGSVSSTTNIPSSSTTSSADTKPVVDDKPKTDEQKIKDMENDIEKKTQELKDKIKKAKAW